MKDVAKRAVVTGGAGFLGSWVCEELLRRGLDVVCIDSCLTGSRANLEHLEREAGFSFVRADVSDSVPVDEPVDFVVHLASPASPVHYQRFPIETLRVGSLGTLNALELARRDGARFVLASTSEVYGDPLQHPQREDYWGNVNPVGPRSMYDESKRFAEALTTAYRSVHGVRTGIVRIFNTYGPRMRSEDGRVVSTFVSQALAGAPLTVAGDGTQTRAICYVEDTVRGIVSLTMSEHSGPVNIGSPEEMSVRTLANRVVELTRSDSDVVFVPLPGDDPRQRRPDISLAKQLFDWSPQVSVDDGLRRTIEWLSASKTAEAE